MKAVLCKAYGPPEKLVYEDTERPPLGPGDVIEVGAEAKGFSVGDRVIGMCGWNGFAEEVVVARDKALRMPEGMPYEVGTVLPTTYGTTVYALVQRARLRPGESLLVHGATGGVGTAAIEV